jgi:hypothetical protein
MLIFMPDVPAPPFVVSTSACFPMSKVDKKNSPEPLSSEPVNAVANFLSALIFSLRPQRSAVNLFALSLIVRVRLWLII